MNSAQKASLSLFSTLSQSSLRHPSSFTPMTTTTSGEHNWKALPSRPLM